MMTAFGWADSGGGTTVPRLAAKELARRGWDVTVFHAAVGLTPTRSPYETLEWEEDGVRLVGVHNRPHGIFDLGRPDRELDDPPISALFEAALDRLKPDVVHFHNLHNLGASLIDQVAVRDHPQLLVGVPSRLSADRRRNAVRRPRRRPPMRRLHRQRGHRGAPAPAGGDQGARPLRAEPHPGGVGRRRQDPGVGWL
jgi:hypothetical protein